VGSLKFYEREEVKDMLALLSFLVNPRDEIAFRRMVNKPSRGAGPATVDRIVAEAAKLSSCEGQLLNLALATKSLAPELSAKARQGVAVFLKAIEAGRSALSNERDFSVADSGPAAGNPLDKSTDKSIENTVGNSAKQKNKKTAAKSTRPGLKGRKAGVGLSACVVNLAVERGIAEHYLSEDEIAGNQRVSNLQEVANAASLYEASQAGLLEFLEHIELDRSMEEASGAGEDAVTLITLHNTKGLEFRRVIMTGVEQGVFPREDKHGEDLEEERRLFYVGATRAMDELYLTSCAYRRMFGRTVPMEPSIFLREIDGKTLRIIGRPPRGFGISLPGSYGKGGAFSPRKPAVSSDGRWTLGDRVFNDDHGYGSITQILEGEDGPVVKVVFETGHETRFLSRHQSSRFTKIKED
jgi:DNA helicase-2/ATP-dependent DNA helicase PcrA